MYKYGDNYNTLYYYVPVSVSIYNVCNGLLCFVMNKISLVERSNCVEVTKHIFVILLKMNAFHLGI